MRVYNLYRKTKITPTRRRRVFGQIFEFKSRVLAAGRSTGWFFGANVFFVVPRLRYAYGTIVGGDAINFTFKSTRSIYMYG